MFKKFSSTALALIIILLMGLMLVIPDICIEGATSGLLLWFNKLLPSLLPFIILINMLCHLGVIFKLSKFLDPLTQLLFKVPATSFLIFLMGLVAGYPMGAKLAKQLLDTKQITYEDAQKTLCFATNCGPLFIIGTVGTLMLNDRRLGYFLAFVHILSALFMLLFSRFYTPPMHTHRLEGTCSTSSKPLSFSAAFTQSVQNGMDTIVYVGGYIIFFSVLINILKSSQAFKTIITGLSKILHISGDTLYNLILGSLEFSNGSALICAKQPLTMQELGLLCALITFGGFCVLFQCAYVLQGSGLSLTMYFISKVLQSILAYNFILLLYPLWTGTYSLATMPLNPLVYCLITFIVIIMIFKLKSHPTKQSKIPTKKAARSF